MIIRDEDPPVDPAVCVHEHVTTLGAGIHAHTYCYDCKTDIGDQIPGTFYKVPGHDTIITP